MTVVAVVEDNADNRLLVRVLLADRYDVREYASAPEALEAFGMQPPDVAVLDISLPGMSGFELLARMRGDPALRGVPAVALTAHSMDGDREACLAAGFDAYVSKPIVDERLLLRAVARCEELVQGRAAGDAA